MEPVEFLVNAKGEKLVIEVPKEFQGKDVKILMMEAPPNSHSDSDTRKLYEMTAQERVDWMMQFMGSAKYPDFPVTKYDVYDQ